MLYIEGTVPSPLGAATRLPPDTGRFQGVRWDIVFQAILDRLSNPADNSVLRASIQKMEAIPPSMALSETEMIAAWARFVELFPQHNHEDALVYFRDLLRRTGRLKKGFRRQWYDVEREWQKAEQGQAQSVQGFPARFGWAGKTYERIPDGTQGTGRLGYVPTPPPPALPGGGRPGIPDTPGRRAPSPPPLPGPDPGPMPPIQRPRGGGYVGKGPRKGMTNITDPRYGVYDNSYEHCKPWIEKYGDPGIIAQIGWWPEYKGETCSRIMLRMKNDFEKRKGAAAVRAKEHQYDDLIEKLAREEAPVIRQRTGIKNDGEVAPDMWQALMDQTRYAAGVLGKSLTVEQRSEYRQCYWNKVPQIVDCKPPIIHSTAAVTAHLLRLMTTDHEKHITVGRHEPEPAHHPSPPPIPHHRPPKPEPGISYQTVKTPETVSLRPGDPGSLVAPECDRWITKKETIGGKRFSVQTCVRLEDPHRIERCLQTTRMWDAVMGRFKEYCSLVYVPPMPAAPTHIPEPGKPAAPPAVKPEPTPPAIPDKIPYAMTKTPEFVRLDPGDTGTLRRPRCRSWKTTYEFFGGRKFKVKRCIKLNTTNKCVQKTWLWDARGRYFKDYCSMVYAPGKTPKPVIPAKPPTPAKPPAFPHIPKPEPPAQPHETYISPERPNIPAGYITGKPTGCKKYGIKPIYKVVFGSRKKIYVCKELTGVWTQNQCIQTALWYDPKIKAWKEDCILAAKPAPKPPKPHGPPHVPTPPTPHKPAKPPPPGAFKPRCISSGWETSWSKETGTIKALACFAFADGVKLNDCIEWAYEQDPAGYMRKTCLWAIRTPTTPPKPAKPPTPTRPEPKPQIPGAPKPPPPPRCKAFKTVVYDGIKYKRCAALAPPYRLYECTRWSTVYDPITKTQTETCIQAETGAKGGSSPPRPACLKWQQMGYEKSTGLPIFECVSYEGKAIKDCVLWSKRPRKDAQNKLIAHERYCTIWKPKL